MPAKITVSETGLFRQGVEDFDLSWTSYALNALEYLQAIFAISRAIDVPINPLIRKKYEECLRDRLLKGRCVDVEASDPTYLREVIGDPIERLAKVTVAIVFDHFDDVALVSTVEFVLKEIFEEKPALKTAFLAVTKESSEIIKGLVKARKEVNRYADKNELTSHAYILVNLGLLKPEDMVDLMR